MPDELMDSFLAYMKAKEEERWLRHELENRDEDEDDGGSALPSPVDPAGPLPSLDAVAPVPDEEGVRMFEDDFSEYVLVFRSNGE